MIDDRPRCRSCVAPLERVVVDLRASPLANSFLRPSQLWTMEPTYPLRVLICSECWLVQLPAQVAPEDIFSEYVYFSSYSDSWLKHAESYVERMTAHLGLSPAHLVVEIASNDGYLLQYFVRRGVRVLGVEPAANIARVAVEKGIPTVNRFFGTAAARDLVASGNQADLVVGNNVLAHVPDLNDFIAGLAQVLKPNGVLTMEFPHLLRLIESVQFDTIYHEHYSYFSLVAAEHAFARHGIDLFDVEELPSHGGSLRIFGRHRESAAHPTTDRIEALRARERAFGLTGFDRYAAFASSVEETKRRLLEFLIEARRAGKSVAGYGAPAKGNTLLNYCGIGTDLLEYTVDRSEHKHGTFLPGSRIPVLAPSAIAERRPDYVLILPWNLRAEIVEQMAHVRDWGGRFVVPVPTLEVLA